MDAVDRLTEDYLAKVEAELNAIRSQLRTPRLSGQPADRKAVLHCHSALSHDSRGSLDEIADAAKSTGSEVVMITDHPRSDIDVIADGFKGKKRGVLFIPGAETEHLLIFLADGRLDYSLSQREMIAQVRKMGGMAFLSHLEEQNDWGLDGLSGTEIYNTHGSFKMQRRLSRIFRPGSPSQLEKLLEILLTIDSHPDTGLSAICEIPHDYLLGWDRLLCRSRATGIAANDSHANYTIRVRTKETGDLQIEDFLGRVVAALPSDAGIARRMPGQDVTFRPDSYEASFRHVGTHLFLNRLNDTELMECLSNGRCYVGFDWLAATEGFSYRWETSRSKGLTGGVVRAREKPVLLANLPAPADLALKRDGKVVVRLRSNVLEYSPPSPGAYRLEAYLELVGEARPWIYSNPIYVTGG